MFGIYLAIALVAALGGVVLLAVHLAKRGQKHKDDAESLAKVLDDVQKANEASGKIDRLPDHAAVDKLMSKWSRE